MLKLLTGCVASLVILFTFLYACAPPAHAASANLVLTQIQAGGAGAALQELVVIYNNSSDEIDISDICLENKSGVIFTCFLPRVPTVRHILPAYSFATAASTAFAANFSPDYFTNVYFPNNQSSGAITGGSDTIKITTEVGEIFDEHSWLASLIGGLQLMRYQTASTPLTYIDTNQASDWAIKSPLPPPTNQALFRDIPFDACLNLEGQQLDTPVGMEVDLEGNCFEVGIFLSPRITEVLPNAAGSDTGNEFIEFYNPNEVPVDLSNYLLWYGPELDKSAAFPVGVTIPPKSYLSFTNHEMPFSLINSSSRLKLATVDGMVVGEIPAYEDPGDGQSWALIDEVWQYTHQPTPSAANLAVVSQKIETIEKPAELQPCASNQYRHPETNRCRLIASTTPTQTPCKENQYRSKETNRCRNIASGTEGPTPCKEGQERNPETNRCRNIVAMSNAGHGVLGAQTTSTGGNWYMWLAIGGLLLLAIAYGVWEWRQELRQLFFTLKNRLIHHK